MTHIRVFLCFIDPNAPRRKTFLTLLLANPQLLLPPGCLCASLSEPQETGQFTCTTLDLGNWVAASLRGFRVGVVRRKPPPPVRDPRCLSSPLVFAAARAAWWGDKSEKWPDQAYPSPKTLARRRAELPSAAAWTSLGGWWDPSRAVPLQPSLGRVWLEPLLCFGDRPGLWQERPQGSPVPRVTGEVRSSPWPFIPLLRRAAGALKW